MTAAMYLLLLVALVCANLPFVSVRWFGIKRLPEKRFAHHLPELLLGFAFVALLAYLLEAQGGNVHRQHWQFYVAVVCLYLVFAFPGFVLRYFWRGRNRE
ncbi:DUF2818 family protein [Eikenella sp. S3360]|uniref:DUF2818 family protein n=1 Tax=Eikenella glucosivorans TaxID=2766967 RepID=A0ABS0NCZ9_9NEIS|nr:DUF2818 family protein [Eikenella glucosivorans]MBH5330168.1 DUF2818 family protein [Eikenella glucosivorans]